MSENKIKNGIIVATGVNPQGVSWNEISFILTDEERKTEKTRNEFLMEGRDRRLEAMRRSTLL